MARTFFALLVLAATAQSARSTDVDVRTAIERGLKRVQTAASNYIENRSCFSCHHQLAVPVMAEARERGFTVDSWVLWSQTEVTRESFRPKLDRIVKGQGVPGANTMAAYALFVLEAGGAVPDETTTGLVQFLTIQQHRD